MYSLTYTEKLWPIINMVEVSTTRIVIRSLEYSLCSNKIMNKRKFATRSRNERGECVCHKRVHTDYCGVVDLIQQDVSRNHFCELVS
jgi:hypothetical protein